MTDEEAWHRHFDAHPDDFRGREVFADWLQDRDDPRAEGYRALGLLKRAPYQFGTSYEHWHWSSGRKAPGERNPQRFLPRDWFRKLEGEKYKPAGNWWSDWPWFASQRITRREAEDAAALAFARLTAKQKVRILGNRMRATA